MSQIIGTHPNGNITNIAKVNIKEGQILKFDEGLYAPTTAATDEAIGVALGDAKAGEPVACAILGSYTGTIKTIAGGAIAQGAQIAADGTASAAATDVIIGRALTAAAAAGDEIEITHQTAQVK